ncbi:MAG: hypothetical protein RR860_18070, partial [Janthinobacterium sp.]
LPSTCPSIAGPSSRPTLELAATCPNTGTFRAVTHQYGADDGFTPQKWSFFTYFRVCGTGTISAEL